VSKHEHYQEICAAASIGQATPEELFELERHTHECDACQQIYFDYLKLAAERFATTTPECDLGSQSAKECLDSELFTKRFFERAEREGIAFSTAVGQEVQRLVPTPLLRAKRRRWPIAVRAIAAVLIVGVSTSVGFFYARRIDNHVLESNVAALPEREPSSSLLDGRISELTVSNARLEAEIDRLKDDLATTTSQLHASRDLHSSAQDREALLATRAALEKQLGTVQQELAESQALVANAQHEAVKQDERVKEVEAQLVDGRIRIADLTGQLSEKSAVLDKERQLLALGRDVSDLMGARNLHIVDVVDTDPKGKTRPAFGRVFFTDGKSLVFYAYDLNEAKLEKTNYQYRVWAKQESAERQVRNLGIFYSDDKSQRRWVFKCDDPSVLKVIDSVFVTLEPANADPSHPEGPNLMYAYLRGQPNHP